MIGRKQSILDPEGAIAAFDLYAVAIRFGVKGEGSTVIIHRNIQFPELTSRPDSVRIVLEAKGIDEKNFDFDMKCISDEKLTVVHFELCSMITYPLTGPFYVEQDFLAV